MADREAVLVLIRAALLGRVEFTIVTPWYAWDEPEKRVRVLRDRTRTRGKAGEAGVENAGMKLDEEGRPMNREVDDGSVGILVHRRNSAENGRRVKITGEEMKQKAEEIVALVEKRVQKAVEAMRAESNA